jgi:hypothetical protein
MRNENMGSKTRRGSALGAIWALKAEGSKLKGILTVWTFQLTLVHFRHFHPMYLHQMETVRMRG